MRIYSCRNGVVSVILFQLGALSSVVEHYLHTVGVAGSKPAARTIRRSSSYGRRAILPVERPLPYPAHRQTGFAFCAQFLQAS